MADETRPAEASATPMRRKRSMSVSTKAFSDMILLEAAENGDKNQMTDCLSDYRLVQRLAIARDEENRTALHLAALESQNAIVDMLLGKWEEHMPD